MKKELTDLVGWSHFFLSEVLEDGDTALDLTAGAGKDTLFLAKRVASRGKVFSFDIQEEALARTSWLLRRENICFSLYDGLSNGLTAAEGVHLIHASHDRIKDYVYGKVKAIIANLGYLPGGDKNLTTMQETTLVALCQSKTMLAAGGRLAVVAYVGHFGGREEEQGVSRFFRSLTEKEWQVMKFAPWNRENPPVLWVAEKR